jgi:hypothetical protein
MELGTNLHRVLLERKPLLIIPEDVLSVNGAKSGKKWKKWASTWELS